MWTCITRPRPVTWRPLKRLQPIIMQISTTIYTIGQHGSSYLKGLKCALSLLGICDDFVAMPFHKFNAPNVNVYAWLWKPCR